MYSTYKESDINDHFYNTDSHVQGVSIVMLIIAIDYNTSNSDKYHTFPVRRRGVRLGQLLNKLPSTPLCMHACGCEVSDSVCLPVGLSAPPTNTSQGAASGQNWPIHCTHTCLARLPVVYYLLVYTLLVPVVHQWATSGLLSMEEEEQEEVKYIDLHR
jgi:hypothetical protein